MTEESKILIHASIERESEKNILALAKDEKRSKSAMIAILLDEALEQRHRKTLHKT